MREPSNRIYYLTILGIVVLFMASAQTVISQTKPYEDLLSHRSGFAKDVTGGKGGEVFTITAVGNEGFRQLKKAVNNDKPKWIRFSPGLKGSILIDGRLMFGANTTIDGRGADITFEGKNDVDGNFVDGKKNIIFHNITIYRMGHVWDKGEGISLINGADLIWIDHVTFRNNSDESLSMGNWHKKNGLTAARVTVSYCHFDHTPKGILAAWGPGQGFDIRLTVHHTAFTNGVSRIPLLRHGWVHFFNNYVYKAGWSGAEIHENAQGLIQNNYYSGGDTVIFSGTNQWDTVPGWICASGNVFVNGAKKLGVGYDCNKVFKAANYYDYHLSPANKELVSMIMKYSGRNDTPQWPDENKSGIKNN